MQTPSDEPAVTECVMRKASDLEREAKTQDATSRPAFQRPLRKSWCLVLFLLLCPTAVEAETLTGKPYVTDGDTIKISGKLIRLEGIDAPETKQRCRDAAAKNYGCGLAATAALKNKIGRNSITCKGTTRDRYGRLLGTCYLDELDLNGWLVQNGYALAYRRYSKRYIAKEKEARETGSGLWSGEFVVPWNWRKGERLSDPAAQN